MLKFNAFQSAKVSESIATKNQNVTKESKVLALLRKDATMTTTEIGIVRKGGKGYGYWEIYE